jgi:hypothetical protein
MKALGRSDTYRAGIADWCFRNAERCLKTNRPEPALMWSQLTARVLSGGHSEVTSIKLEEQLIAIANCLPRVQPVQDGVTHRNRWLHVFTTAYATGGHTAMAVRWIEANPTNGVHSAALLSQDAPVPDSLTRAVTSSGGDLNVADIKSSLLSRALWLRQLASGTADYVVLHIHPWDVMPTVAFGVPEGPPVLLVNHAAHAFWLGVSISDLVLNVRGSELEQQWTRVHRGVRLAATLPIPLPMPLVPASAVEPEKRRASAKRQLGIPEDAVLVLSVGTGFKYRPAAGLNFIDAARSVLLASPKAYLLVVGLSENSGQPREDGRPTSWDDLDESSAQQWMKAKEEVSGRLRGEGRQLNLESYHAAADVYAEGFPFGSTTALLEAGLKGIPAVLAPCPPPFGTDGIAVDSILPRPANSSEYVSATTHLIQNREDRQKLGDSLSGSIMKHHAGSGWVQHLSAAITCVPKSHSVQKIEKVIPVSEHLVEYWSAIVNNIEGGSLFDPVYRDVLDFRLAPTLDMTFLKAYWHAQPPGTKLSKTLRLLGFEAVISCLPKSARLWMFDLLTKRLEIGKAFKNLGKYWSSSKCRRGSIPMASLRLHPKVKTGDSGA